MPADSLRFVWQRQPAASYRLFVADSTGRSVFSMVRTDTTAALPPTVHLVPGARYFWEVDAIRADGTSLSSTHRAFTVSSNR